MILDPWAGEGSLDAATVVDTAYIEREGWAALRSLNGDQTFDVVRYELSGGDASRGIPASRTAVSDLSGIPVLVGDVTVEEADVRGLRMEQGMRSFETFSDVDVRLTDVVLHGGETFAVVRVYRDANIGQTIVYARPSPAGD